MKSFIDKHCEDEWKAFIDFHKEVRTYKKGDYIFKAEEETLGLFFVDSGKVKVVYKEYDGSERLIRLASEGDILGHRGFGGTWKYTISALALCNTEVSFISLKTFDTIAKANPNFTYQLMIYFAEELRKSEAKIKKYPVKNLIARAILENYKAFGFESEGSTKLAYTLSRKDFANKAGTTYESAVRTLADLKKEKVIDTEGKSIHILDIKALKELARPQYKK